MLRCYTKQRICSKMANYKISEKNFDEIQRTLDILLNSVNTPQHKNMLMQISGTLNHAKLIEGDTDKEILTDKKMQELFGSNTNGIIYFNYDTGKWNRTEYMNTPIRYTEENTKYAYEFKKSMKNEPVFQDTEIIAYVIMAIKNTHYMDYEATITNPTYCPDGDFIVANIVRRSKKDGCILPINPTWTCYGRCGKPSDLTKNIARFAINTSFEKQRNSFLSTFRQR